MTENIQLLLRSIEGGNREEVWEAAKQLESITLEVVSALLKLLKNAKQADARAASAYVLGFCRYSSARIDLEQILDDTSEEAFVRGHAAEALAYLGSKESVEILLKHLEDKDAGVRYWCIFALGKSAMRSRFPRYAICWTKPETNASRDTRYGKRSSTQLQRSVSMGAAMLKPSPKGPLSRYGYSRSSSEG